ncbi:putative reverse transcriptase domain, reverse transcriptase zinc-binding domain protein [Tanacetum coccineum]
MRRFLWLYGSTSKGKSKVAWEVVCLPKIKRRLSIRRLDHFNKALMISHIWRLLSLKEYLWVQWIHAYKVKGRNFWDIPCWGNMTWGWRKILQLRPVIRQHIRYKVGDGLHISVWHDGWCDVSPLSAIVSSCNLYRAGFSHATVLKEVIINGQFAWPQEWNIRYPILDSIYTPLLVPNMLDTLEWRGHDGGIRAFSMSEVWECIRPRADKVDWFDIVWFSQCIPRHAFHTWLVIKRKLKTQDCLRHWDIRSITDVTMLHCPLCRSQPDSHEHLFFECSFSLQIWSHLKPFAGLSGGSDALISVIDQLIFLSKSNHTSSVFANLTFAAACYYIWQERNERLFKNQRRSPNQILEGVISMVRLKLLTCRIKKSQQVLPFMHLWRLPDSILYA